ncbi:MAG: hypothetical protein QOF02_3337 [Blastocatellia bacterium]|jgi:hypothetical protein|nr:hypothetical protein [Blastocatellia bacterium]
MNARSYDTNDWQEANRDALLAAVARLRSALELYLERRAGVVVQPALAESPLETNDSEALEPALLADLREKFSLSNFERDVLLMCVALELDAAFAPLCAAAHDEARRAFPTFALAFEILEGAHWSAVAPGGALRRWRLIEIGAGETLMTSQLRVDERVLHFLLGVYSLDERLQSFVEPVAPIRALPISYRAHAEQIVTLWTGHAEQQELWPVIQLTGDGRGGQLALAAVSCGQLGLRLHALRASDIPANGNEREALARLWEREALLSNSGLLIDLNGTEQLEAVSAFAERLRGLLFIAGDGLLRLNGRAVVRLVVNRPEAAEQRALWENSLGPLAAKLNGHLDKIVAQFPFDVPAIENTGRALRESAQLIDAETLGALLWDNCRALARPRLEGQAERVETLATWDDIVLPEAQLQTLREISIHVRQRTRVYDTWGFAARGLRGLGITALFAGASGTGKTLAAEIIASELKLDLYRIDLSRVVSKYIGETEKNLRGVFDAAEEGGAILLFDEADALFGKRSEVKDAHDRFANIEVSYLLQRMESYRGLAILTTNLRGSLDQAFLRRIRFIVSFPFPDASLRARIWQRIFPHATPTEGLDIGKLARLNLTGGNIRNIALNAAFLAAESSEPVRMRHLLHTARGEYGKMERQLSETEIGGWL